MKKIYFLFFLLCLNFSLVFSQQLTNKKTDQEPIEIYADDGIEWHKNDKKYIAKGNAKAVSGSMILESDIIEAHYDDSNSSDMDIYIVKALGNVIINDKKLKIVGGKTAEYDLKKDYFKINGKRIKLLSEFDELNANKKIEYWRSKDIAVATGKAVAIKKNEFTIRAEKLVWYFYKNPKATSEDEIDVKKIIGFQNVSIKTNNEVAFSDKALYNRDKEICKLFGNVKLQKGDSFLLGEYAEIDLVRGISKLMPKGPGDSFLNEDRVKALIDKGDGGK